MGLDMYLHRQRAGGPTVEVMHCGEGDAFDYEAFKAWDDTAQVAYWRKANAIHAWFVDHVQGGIDECQFAPVDREQLAGLVSRCQRVLDGAPPETLLPSRSGFFFGTTEYDEDYRDDLRKTIKMLEPLLTDTSGDTFIYHSSW